MISEMNLSKSGDVELWNRPCAHSPDKNSIHYQKSSAIRKTGSFSEKEFNFQVNQSHFKEFHIACIF